MSDGGAVVSIKRATDPFADCAPATVREVLTSKGWAGVVLDAAGLALELSELVVVVASGKLGEKSLARLMGAHGELPPTPRFIDPASATVEPRIVRVFRRPAGVQLPSAPNLHGAVPGVSLLATGREIIPPCAKGGVDLRWQAAAHPATLRVAELPMWLVEMARDPAAAHRAWGTSRPTREEVRVLSDWERELSRVRGGVARTFGNLCTILRASPKYAGRIVFNELQQGPTLDGRSITEGALGRIREDIERDLGVAFGADDLRAAVQNVAEERRVHPVKEYLTSLRWDGVARLDAVAGTILGAVGELQALMVRRFFVGAVARVMRPGCKLDTALVLVGPQGWRKSTFYQVTFGEWFTDTHVDLSSKDAFLQLAGSWGIEWGEIERVTGRRGADEIKSFLSSRVDRFRPPYGRSVIEVQRTCVLCGSTNQATFLDDDTGSRRFWIVRVNQLVDIATLTAWRDQLWAEAMAMFSAGEPWWLEAEAETSRAEDAEQHSIEDGWTGAVLRYVALHSIRDEFTASEVLQSALEVPKRDHDRTSVARVGRILRAAGWERRKHRPLREGVRGDPVWCWFRPIDPNAPKLPMEGDDADMP